jgi:hypothetical protein
VFVLTVCSHNETVLKKSFVFISPTKNDSIFCIKCASSFHSSNMFNFLPNNRSKCVTAVNFSVTQTKVLKVKKP